MGPGWVQTSQSVVLFSPSVLKLFVVRIRSVLRACMSNIERAKGSRQMIHWLLLVLYQGQVSQGSWAGRVYVRGTGHLPKRVSSISKLSQHQTPYGGSCHHPRLPARCPKGQASADLCPSPFKDLELSGKDFMGY